MADKSGSGSQFSDQDVKNLIRCYQSETDLWLASSVKYHKEDRREAGWRRIASMLDHRFSVEQLKKKMETLRGQYTRDLGKELRSAKTGAGAREVFKSGWKFFKQLDAFLRGVCTPKASVSGHTPPGPRETGDKECEGRAEGPDGTPADVAVPKRRRLTKADSALTYAVDVIRNATAQQQLLQQQQRQEQEQQRAQKENFEEDEDVLYAKLVLSALRKIQDPDIKFEVKQTMDKLLYDAQSISRRGPQSQLFRPFDT